MKGTKKIFTLLIFPVAVAFTGGCSSPIGGLLIDSTTLDFIRAEPERFVYRDDYDPFIPAQDVKVFGFFGRKKTPIAIEEVKITISGLPYSTEDVIILKEGVKDPVLLSSGIKDILISYRGEETNYHISVGETKTGDGDGGDDDSGKEIIPIWP